MSDVRISWNDEGAEEEAAAFITREAGRDRSYISHGEIQFSLSPDGENWAEDREARYLKEYQNRGGDDQCFARNGSGRLLGLAYLSFKDFTDMPFATLADIVVAADARGQGIGETMVAAIMQRAKDRGAQWMFLESGKDNHAAHAFFEGRGFRKTSEVFARRLD